MVICVNVMTNLCKYWRQKKQSAAYLNKKNIWHNDEDKIKNTNLLPMPGPSWSNLLCGGRSQRRNHRQEPRLLCPWPWQKFVTNFSGIIFKDIWI